MPRARVEEQEMINAIEGFLKGGEYTVVEQGERHVKFQRNGKTYCVYRDANGGISAYFVPEKGKLIEVTAIG